MPTELTPVRPEPVEGQALHEKSRCNPGSTVGPPAGTTPAPQNAGEPPALPAKPSALCAKPEGRER